MVVRSIGDTTLNGYAANEKRPSFVAPSPLLGKLLNTRAVRRRAACGAKEARTRAACCSSKRVARGGNSLVPTSRLQQTQQKGARQGRVQAAQHIRIGKILRSIAALRIHSFGTRAISMAATPPAAPSGPSQTPGGQAPNGKPNKPSKAKAALDPAEIEAKRKARAEKKEKEAQEKAHREEEAAANGTTEPLLDEHGKPFYRPRDWARVPNAVSSDNTRPRVKVLSWNMLAQGLVRRKLFPGSDALRWKDREAGLAAELIGHGWDVGCFQEVDRLECHAETLRKAGYSHVYAKGYSQKQHGLMLAWRSSAPRNWPRILFEPEAVAQSTFFYDDAEVSPGRTGCSRVTRNIALFAAIKFKGKEGGVILATTHLFWHPMHAYERVRQTGLLVRALDEFRNRSDAVWKGWPTILAGDFNDQPHSASYRLLNGMGLDQHGREEIAQSRVVHQSIDDRGRRRREGAEQQTAILPRSQTVPGDSTDNDTGGDHDEDEIEEGAEDEEEDEEGGADDQMLKNCRSAKDSDELLTLSEIPRLFDLSQPPLGVDVDSAGTPHLEQQTPTPLRSAYASAYRLLQAPSEDDNLFSTPTRGRERWDDPDWKEGDLNVHSRLEGTAAGNEPMWTLYSSLFSLTLDFIFLLPHVKPSGQGAQVTYPTVTQLLRTHRTDVLKNGLPRKGICVSDHVAIGAEVEL